MIKSYCVKYGYIAAFVCVCAVYLALLIFCPKIFERVSYAHENTSVTVYDGRISGRDFQIRVADEREIEILYESGKSVVGLSGIAYTDIDGHFVFKAPGEGKKTFWFDVRPTDGKYVYIGGERARTTHLYFQSKAGEKVKSYYFDFWCAVIDEERRPAVKIR